MRAVIAEMLKGKVLAVYAYKIIWLYRMFLKRLICGIRAENDGFFKTLEELLNVYGIGNATYRKVRDYVILHE